MLPRIILSLAFLAIIALQHGLFPATLRGDQVVIVLDDSGSMNERMQGSRTSRLDAAKKALSQVLQQIPPGTNVGVLLLNGAGRDHWLVPLGPLDAAGAIRKINGMKANGGTPLGDAMRIAADQLLQARTKSVYGTFRMVVVTDGEATDPQLLAQFLPDILSRGLVVDAIGVDMKTDHALATRVHSYRRANDEASLQSAVAQVMAENAGDDQSSTEEDFALLSALDEIDVSEVLKALATPNNQSITGVAARSIGTGTPGAFSPPSNAGTAPAATGVSFLNAALGTLCSCLLPVIVALMIFITVVSRNNKRRR